MIYLDYVIYVNMKLIKFFTDLFSQNQIIKIFGDNEIKTTKCIHTLKYFDQNLFPVALCCPVHV